MKRFLSVVWLAGAGFAAIAAEGPVSSDKVTVQTDVAYLESGRGETLDLYLPAKRAAGLKSPAMVIIHGGGWTGGSKSAQREIKFGHFLAESGYVCVSVEYLKEGKDRWPTNLKDCKNAVRFLRANAEKYQVDPENIGVIGGSAGGHLALMVAYTSQVKELSPEAPYPGVRDDVKVCVDLYGISNLLTRQGTEPDGTPNGKLREAGLFPDKRGENVDKWKLASPVNHITAKTPPTLVMHGMIDTTVDRDQSIELAAKLKEAGVEHRLELLPGIGHTFDLDGWQKKKLPIEFRPLLLEFLDKYLRPRK